MMKRRRPRRDAPAADHVTKILYNLFAPPCLGEALRRGTLINFYDFPENNEQEYRKTKIIVSR